MKRRPWRVGAAALCALALPLGGVLTAAAEPPARSRAFAGLPDWSGIWGTEAGAGLLAGKLPEVPALWRKPPYTAQAEQQYAPSGFPLDGATNLFGALDEVASTFKACGQNGFPAVMEVPVPDYLFELLVTPEQTLLLASDGTVRHIYTDGRGHTQPEDLWPTATGDSIGHWEGTTLVVDTIARESGPVGFFPGAANLSEQAHFVERLQRVNANTFEDQMTIDDPPRFARRWQFTIRYARAQDLNRLIPSGTCEHDRNPLVNGKIVVAPPQASPP